MVRKKGEIRVQSFNPYAKLFSNRNVISREELHLIKFLRSEGYKVVIEPDNNNEINFLTEKGIREFLMDPIIMILINIPLSIISGLITSYLYNRFKRKLKNDEVNVILEIDEKGNKLHYKHTGQPISDKKFKELIKSLEKRFKTYCSSLKISPPELSRPFPIYLEHTEKIIGWANVYENSNGLKAENVK
jgi:hypothetical protein